MDKKEINLIGDVDFKNVKVKVYNDPYTNKNVITSAWQMRNPNTCYEGYMYIDNETGKISYPENTIIPEQTDEDRGILPKFIITGYKIIDDKFISFLTPKLEEEYKIRNNI